MKWTVTERPSFCDGEPQLTVFEIHEGDGRAAVAGAQSSEHCPGYGWTADELRERVRLMAAAPALRDALEGTLDWLASYPGFGSEAAWLNARAALALLDASEVAS